MIRKFRILKSESKPKEGTAVQYDGKNDDEILEFCPAVIRIPDGIVWGKECSVLLFVSGRGQKMLAVGDWIAKIDQFFHFSDKEMKVAIDIDEAENAGRPREGILKFAEIIESKLRKNYEYRKENEKLEMMPEVEQRLCTWNRLDILVNELKILLINNDSKEIEDNCLNIIIEAMAMYKSADDAVGHTKGER